MAAHIERQLSVVSVSAAFHFLAAVFPAAVFVAVVVGPVEAFRAAPFAGEVAVGG